jgi:Rieske Fe-S protein
MTTEPKAPSRLDPEPVSRRDFLGLTAVAAAAAALGFAAIGLGLLPLPAVIPAPSKKFRIALPESLAPDAPFIPPGRSVALFRGDEGIHAVSLICTHLGCIVKPNETGFECPCHGSKFHPDGGVVVGPAPKALPWLQVEIGPDGLVTVDEGVIVPVGTYAKA